MTVAARHVSLIRPGATEAQSDDTYEVDDCFGSDLGTAEAYKRILHPSVKQVVDGFNAAALTVGCTGSGKSTLLHGRSGDGTARLAIKALFEALHNKAAHVGLALSQHKASGGGGQAMEFAVDASFCEVYEERVRDLFVNDQSGRSRGGGSGAKKEGSFLEVEESSDEGWHVAGLTSRSAPDAQSLQNAYAAALNQRVTGLSEYGHSKHDRAASILTLRVSQYVPGLPERDGTMTSAQHLVNTLVIADCPGAEPLAMDPAVLRLREGARLNRAVLSMAGVVRALATQRREFAGHGDSVLTKVLSEPLGGNCATTIVGTLRLGEWERSAAVMDLLDNARRATTFPVVCDDAARGLQQRLRSRMLQINDARETYREQVQSTGADGIDPQNIGLQMAKLHELEGRLLEERGDKAELLAEKEALLERLQRLNGMDKENLAEKEELQAALIRSEEDRLEIARALVEVQLEANEAALEAEKTRHDLVERVHELEARAIASEVRVKGAEQGFGEMREKSGSLEVKNEQLRIALEQTREELEADLTALRGEHADVMGEVGGLKARNDDLVSDVDDLRKRLAMEVRRAEEAESERDDFRAVAEKESGTLQKKVEAAEKAAEEAIGVAETQKTRLVQAAQQERDEAVAAARESREKAVKAAHEERDEEVAKARAARDRAVEDIRKEMKALVFEARREKEEAVAAAHADKASTTAYLENDRDARVAKAEKDRDEAVAKAQRDMLSNVAEAQKERDEAVEKATDLAKREVDEAIRERDAVTRKYDTETKRLRELADNALGKIEGVARALEASKSAENRARVEADRATGECAQLKEKLETARGEYSARINEYMLQVGELERGASVLSVDPNSEHVLRPSQLSQAAQAMAKDLHRGGGAGGGVQARDGAAARATGRDAEGPARTARGVPGAAAQVRGRRAGGCDRGWRGPRGGGASRGRDFGHAADARRGEGRGRAEPGVEAGGPEGGERQAATGAAAGRAGRKGTPGARERRRGGGRRVLSGKARRRRRRAQRRKRCGFVFRRRRSARRGERRSRREQRRPLRGFETLETLESLEGHVQLHRRQRERATSRGECAFAASHRLAEEGSADDVRGGCAPRERQAQGAAGGAWEHGQDARAARARARGDQDAPLGKGEGDFGVEEPQRARRVHRTTRGDQGVHRSRAGGAGEGKPEPADALGDGGGADQGNQRVHGAEHVGVPEGNHAAQVHHTGHGAGAAAEPARDRRRRRRRRRDGRRASKKSSRVQSRPRRGSRGRGDEPVVRRAEKRRGATRGAARERTGGGQVGERRDLTGRVVRAIGVVTSEARLDSPLRRAES